MNKVLQQLDEAAILNRLMGADEKKVKDGFFSNYLAALLLLKLQDLKGLMLINDRSHSKLTRFSDSMSDVNFWGAALFYPKNPEVRNRLQPGHADALATEAGRIMDHRVQWLMKVPMTAPEQVHWMEVIGSLVLLKMRFGENSSYFRNIVNYLSRWETLSEGDKKRAVSQSFMYLMQSDPKSKLLPRMRTLAGSLLLKKVADVAQTVVGFKRIMEDNAIVGSDAGTGGKADCTSVGNVNTNLQGLFKLEKMAKTQVTKKGKYIFRDNKLIKKKAKKFKARKFKAPSSLKATGVADQGSGE